MAKERLNNGVSNGTNGDADGNLRDCGNGTIGDADGNLRDSGNTPLKNGGNGTVFPYTKIVLIDSTWNQCRGIHIDERLAGKSRVWY